MTFSHLNRRVHLYLGLALLPWFAMYGVSSIPFAHNQFFQRRDAATGLPLWTLRLDKPLDVAPPADPRALRSFGARLLQEAGIRDVSYGTYRASPTRIEVYAYTFWTATRLRYDEEKRRLTVEDRRFRWDHFLTGMHARGGFEQEGLLARSWSVVVDIVCVAMVVWVASGVYMWWGLRRHRLAGLLTTIAGTGAFALFTLGL